ncbi:MAG: hypothetical protein ACQERC_06120 [Bacteroidota bacterium]
MKQKLLSTMIFFGALVAMTTTSCQDPELDAMMEEYCACIREARYDQSAHSACRELMDSIQEKYKHQPRKLNTVLEKTNDCY